MMARAAVLLLMMAAPAKAVVIVVVKNNWVKGAFKNGDKKRSGLQVSGVH